MPEEISCLPGTATCQQPPPITLHEKQVPKQQTAFVKPLWQKQHMINHHATLCAYHSCYASIKAGNHNTKLVIIVIRHHLNKTSSCICKKGSGRIGCNALAMEDFPEQEAPVKRITSIGDVGVSGAGDKLRRLNYYS